MNTLLIFFAIPVAIIILSVVLQIRINSPVQVAAVFFAILLVVTFAFFDATFLIATIIYTLLAFATALITCWILDNLIDSNCLCGGENSRGYANREYGR